MKKLPIGIQDFRKLREGDYLYVDKTEIIYKLASSGTYYFLSRPRRFGKSLLVSTLKELFQGSRELFDGLWIADRWNWEEQHPVIHISFNDIGVKELGLKTAIFKMLDKNATMHGFQLREDSLALRFKELIEQLSKKGKVVLLIDEYDKPIIDYVDDLPQAAENRELLRSFYSIIKGADGMLRFVLITGISKFSKVSIFSDLNNLEDITLSANFNSICGYTQSELEGHFEQYIQSLQADLAFSQGNLLGLIKEWYNGYTWTGKERLYNPFSILNFFKKRQFQNFWFSTGTPTFLVKLLQKDYHYQLEDGEVGSVQLDFFDIEDPDYRSLLFQTGYLTIKDQPVYNIYTLGYPNKEVKDSLLQYLIGAYSYQGEGNAAPMVLKLKKSLASGNTANFVSILNSLFASIPEKIFRQRSESSYHAIVYTSLSLLGFYIESEVAAGEGYVDAVVKTDTTIYVMEFKYDKPAAAALAQIREKGYAEPYRHDGRQVTLLGISFGRTVKGITEWKEELL